MKKETPEEKEYWNTIMLGVQTWGIIILYYIPELKELGISNNDITNHFKEILEAHIGEQQYNSKCSKEKSDE
jgi:hypothetical protein